MIEGVIERLYRVALESVLKRAKECSRECVRSRECARSRVFESAFESV